MSVVVRSYLGPVVNIAEVPFLFAALTVAASSWFGGWGPGVVHALLLIGIVQYFLVAPERGLEYVLSDTQVVRMSLFGLQCIVLSIIIDRLVKSRRAVQFRIAHQDVEIALRDAVLRSTGSRAGDAEAISNILRALVRELECEAGIAWSVNGSATPVASVARGSMTAESERPSPREQRRRARVESFVRHRVSDGVGPDDLVRQCAREGIPIAGQHEGSDRLVQHALALPVVDGDEADGSHVYVFELRRTVTFAPTPEALQLFESLVHDIEQCRRLRSTERTVDVLNRRLLDRAQELETVLEAAPIGLAVSRSGLCDEVRINASAAECLALPRGTRHISTEHADSSVASALRICTAPMLSATNLRLPVGPVELEFHDDDGQVRTIYASASPLVDGEGNVRGCVAALVDITQIRRAELAIREREKAFRRSFECAGVGKAEIDPSTGRFQLVNRRLCEMFGATAADLTGRPFVELLAPHERQRAASILDGILRGDQGAMTEEFEFATHDGTPVFGATSITADYDSRGRATHLIVVIQDVTGRRHAEEELSRYRSRLEDLVQARTAALEGTHRQLRMSERMAALGTMSAGLGHDMGNLLLPVRLRLESMALKGIPAELDDDVQAIGKCAEYLQRLANGLRLLSLDPDQAHLTEHTDLDRWWADIETFLRNTLPRGAELEKRFEPNLPLLPVSRHRLTQAVFNLVQNAADAVREKGSGRVCVAAARTADGTGVCLSVEDNGAGMTPEVRARCLEPFFTSKTRGISTGLGLSLVHGIVHQAGGNIQIESAVSHGTTFRLTFPVGEQPSSAEEPDAGPAPVRIVSSFEDARLRAFAGTIGRSLGCDVDETPVDRLDELQLHTEPRPVLWLADAPLVTNERLERMHGEGGDANRRALAFGQTPEPPADGGAVEYVAQATPSVIRRVIRQAVLAMTDQGGRVGVSSGP